jgi:hypothetical protein
LGEEAQGFDTKGKSKSLNRQVAKNAKEDRKEVLDGFIEPV